jgi:F-type H+-transporting ATPase subunit beta
MTNLKGKIAQVIGPVVDIYFEGSKLPKIYDALEVIRPDGQKVIMETQQHIGEDTVRAISMDSTDGFKRGQEVTATGRPIAMPSGEQIRGRVFNVVGENIDGIGGIAEGNELPIHR